MSDTIITVQGKFSAAYPPERATVTLSVGFAGPEREAVFQRASEAADAVRDSITARHDPVAGPVTRWSSDRVTIWTDRPWNQDGKQLPPVFHAGVDFTVRFKDFEALARWMENVALLSGVIVSGTGWDLTRVRKDAVLAEVRTRAVHEAVAKARSYAESIGLSELRVVAVADPGMLGDRGGESGGPAGWDMLEAKTTGAGTGLTFRPQDIEVSASVDVRFIAH